MSLPLIGLLIWLCWVCRSGKTVSIVIILLDRWSRGRRDRGHYVRKALIFSWRAIFVRMGKMF